MNPREEDAVGRRTGRLCGAHTASKLTVPSTPRKKGERVLKRANRRVDWARHEAPRDQSLLFSSTLSPFFFQAVALAAFCFRRNVRATVYKIKINSTQLFFHNIFYAGHMPVFLTFFRFFGSALTCDEESQTWNKRSFVHTGIVWVLFDDYGMSYMVYSSERGAASQDRTEQCSTLSVNWRKRVWRGPLGEN